MTAASTKTKKPIILCVASGKGGTGKTTVATNLAKAAEPNPITLLDCDVEEPNSHLFFNLQNMSEKTHTVFVPEIDKSLCTVCGQCVQLCQFGALVRIKDKLLVFPELCHSCLGCQLICPENAIGNGQREIGVIRQAVEGHIQLIHGILRISEAMAPPLISEVKRIGFAQDGADYIIIDAPPGTSCPVIESVKDADVVILVTEPTPFGLHDLKLAVEMIKVLQVPAGVVINRSTIGNRDVYQYCQDENIPILMEIPEDRSIAEAYAQGQCLIDALPQYRQPFRTLLENAAAMSHKKREESHA